MKKIGLYTLALFIAAIAAYYGVRAIVIMRATQNAQTLIAENKTPEALTAHIFQEYKNVDNSDNPILFKWRPYLTNDRLPEWIAFPEGALETVYSYGFCDNAARKLGFILRQENISSIQWNMTKPNAAHAVLLATINGEQKLLDPYLGVTGPDPRVAKEKILKNPSYDPFKKLTPESDKIGFYKNFGIVTQSAQGEDMNINANVNFEKQERIVLGQVDGFSRDVRAAGRAENITGIWAYLGHRFDRARVRKFRLSDPARITFILADDYADNVKNWNIEPSIQEEDKLVWVLGKGQELIFRDADAEISLWRLNSYIPVDQVIIEKL